MKKKNENIQNKLKKEKIKLLILILVVIIFTMYLVIGFENIDSKLALLKSSTLLVIMTSFVIISLVILLIISVSKNKESKSAKLFNAVSIFTTTFFTSFAFTLTILLSIFIFFLTPTTVSGSSMNNSLADGDLLLVYVNEFEVKKDDIVIVDVDLADYEVSAELIVKRAIATQNDVISLKGENGDELFVDDVKVATMNVSEYLLITGTLGDYVIPENKTLVLGDNRNNSLDSRFFGLVDNEDIIGKAIIRLLPFSNFGFIDKIING